jgi:hypothetical protein
MKISEHSLIYTVGVLAAGLLWVTGWSQKSYDPTMDAWLKSAFLGHHEFADLVEGTGILAATVDVQYYGYRGGLTPKHVQEMESKLHKLPRLAKQHLGFDELFLLPAIYYGFDTDKIEKADEILSLTYEDPNLHHGVFLLHGMLLAHIFNDIPRAAKAYRRLSQIPNTPAWVEELAQRYERGENPFQTDPRYRKRICTTVKRGFPEGTYLKMKSRVGCEEESP